MRNELRLLLTVQLAATSVVTTACTTSERAIGPYGPNRSLNFSALEIAAKGPRVRVAIPEIVRNIGCAVVGTVNGETQVASLPRPFVNDLVGSLDSIDAPVIQGRPTSGALHVVSGVLSLLGTQEKFSIHCLAPMSLKQNAFSMSLAAPNHRNLPELVTNKLHSYSNPQNTNDEVLASDILLSSISSGQPARLVLGRQATGGLATGIAPRYSTFECGPGTNYACGSPSLPTVIVHAAPGYPIIVDLSNLRFSQRIYSLSDLVGVWFYDGPDCTNASQTWIALYNTIQQLEEEAYHVEQATLAVASQTCEQALTAGGNDLCIDLFIMSEQAAFLVGDNRDFDPNAPFKASRAQIYINPNTCSVESVVNTSRTVTVGPFGGGTHAPHKMNRVESYVNSSGQCVIEWDLLNGYCQTAEIPTIVCPAINGKLILTSNGNGGWNGNINEDKFPSRGLYKWNGSSWSTISERAETIWLDLFTRRRHIERLTIARDQETMPPGCNLE